MRKVHTFTRVPESEKWNRDSVLSIVGTPSDPLNTEGRASVPRLTEEPEAIPAAAGEPEPPQRITRGFWITRADLRKHGYSPYQSELSALQLHFPA